MKHLISIICVLLGCINITKAQVVISTSDLKGTKWQLAIDYDNQSKDYYEYTKGAEVWHRSDGSTFEYPYYLSNSQPTKFDHTKVGVTTKGCYIVELNPKMGDLYCYLILSFDKKDGTMVLKEVFNAGGSGGSSTHILIPSQKPRNQHVKKKFLENW